MSTTEIKTMLSTLQEVVNEVGADFVYERRENPAYNQYIFSGANDATICVYVYNDQPDCIAGRVLHKLGVSLDVLREHEKRSAITFTKTGIPLDALEVLNQAQYLQDKGNTWGDALQGAKDKARQIYGVVVS